MEHNELGRFVVVSNRLPIRLKHDKSHWQIRPGAGGLVTALAPVMARNKGLWIGWPGCGPEAPIEELTASFAAENNYDLLAIPLSSEDVEGYYRGFANKAIWPLFHDLLGHCNFERNEFESYLEVNRKFAETIASTVKPNDLIWIHDYQLMMVAHYLREMGVRQPLSFFLHTPFPTLDLFRRLPWSNEIIRGLLAFDLLGFQTIRDRRNFVQCTRGLVHGAKISGGRGHTTIHAEERTTRAGNFPISIDFDEFSQGARATRIAEEAWSLREQYHASHLILGLDRLDYTKGIPERFLGFERALEKYPQMRETVSLVQVVVPSRTHVPDYRNLKTLIEGEAGRINGRFSRAGWVPIHYHFRSLERSEVLAHYRACQIALITPLRDGMNLVCKEYCASSIDEDSVLILSEFAGAADQLRRGALCVNPYDREMTADAIYRAYSMEPDERRRRMHRLRAEIRRNDVHRWLQWVVSFLRGSWITDVDDSTGAAHSLELIASRH